MVDGVTVPLPRTGGALRLSDIAGQASVSEATVSRVLNGKPGVADTTRQRVLAALDILGYERPVRLRQRSAGLIGLVTPELTNPIFPAFAQSVEQVLAGHGYTPVLCTQLPGGATEDELVEQLVERGVGGIVFLSGLHADLSADPSRYAALTDRGVPFVLINGYNERISAPSSRPTTPPPCGWPSDISPNSATAGSAWPSDRSAMCRPAVNGTASSTPPSSCWA